MSDVEREEHLQERETSLVEQADQWRMCQKIYKRAGRPWYSKHDHIGRHDTWEIREDLWANNCRRILEQMGLWDYE